MRCITPVNGGDLVLESRCRANDAGNAEIALFTSSLHAENRSWIELPRLRRRSPIGVYVTCAFRADELGTIARAVDNALNAP